ncbi:hypothetical protein [Algoriphagus sp. A40]|uniref:hypothetical protein n=1 Tax=Algoriphagus sp. A40 TaxID=1945863 RepID=UPI000985FA8A|nr:hypothetical protein [Algoriphagus sp. A40]OOG77852.1 hypothetical protein B0E43_03565 [Algoriphagus sp. A40]
MARIHAFEWEDQSWFPGFLRNYMTDFLQFLTNKTKMFVPIIPEITSLLEKTGTSNLIDLGSGGGGGLLSLNEELIKKNPDIKFVLTDLYPNYKAFQFTQSKARNFEAVAVPVDARDVPEDLRGVRTMFLAFHHFKPDDAIQILQNAVNSNQPILIVEGQERSVPSFLAMFFSPLTVLFTTPFIRPFSLERIIFTYPIPLVPLFTWWDGMVSCLRTYSVPEMEELISKVKDQEKFEWKTGRVKSGPGYLLFLSGSPKR